MKNKRITVLVTERQYCKLRYIAGFEGKNMSRFIRRLMIVAIKAFEEEYGSIKIQE